MRYWLALGLFLLVSACAHQAPPAPPVAATKPSFQPVSFADLPGWPTDDQAAALVPLRRSCGVLARVDQAKSVGPAALGGTASDWREACDALNDPSLTNGAAARAAIEGQFTPVQVIKPDGDQTGLFTGYYEPLLRGSRDPSPQYPVPLYKRPDDLIAVDLGEFRADYHGQHIFGRVDGQKLVPYYSRAEIDRGLLAHRNLELMWVDDPIDAFFMAIQGSGRIQLPDGRVTRVGYDASNGHRFVPIGRKLVAMGALTKDQVSMQAIRQWLLTHPDQKDAMIEQDPSYVFFTERSGDGPIGAQGLVLTAGRSLAVDPTILALGAPVWVDGDDPSAPDGHWRRLMVAQDTGGAIRGAVRGDIFFGSDTAAADTAGRTKMPGRLYILLPKAVVARWAGS